jgi:outer membrane protein assembly factor BamB
VKKRIQKKSSWVGWVLAHAVGLLVLIIGINSTVWAEAWPTYRHDNRRSGITSEKIDIPLKQSWIYQAPAPPHTAWSDPAKWDAYAAIKPLAPMRDFDSAFFVTVSGDSVYFGSSVEDSVTCVDARTGREKWSFLTEGAVRFPPTITAGKAYFGSDDGVAYCIRADSGELVWKYSPSSENRLVPSNGKLISLWPIRTGLLVQNGKVYFAASLLPWRESYLCCIDALSGSDSGADLYKLAQSNRTIQGAILASPTKLYLPQGRLHPLVCDITSGNVIGTFGGGGEGGVYALLAPDDTFIHGRGQNHRTKGELRGFDAEKRDYIATFPGAQAMVMTEPVAYLHSENELSAFDRGRYLNLQKQINQLNSRQQAIQKELKDLEKKPDEEKSESLNIELGQIKLKVAELTAGLSDCFIWKQPAEYSYELILAGDVLWAGGDNEVAGFDVAEGRLIWKTTVDGKAYGLAVAEGRLFVSTDTGKIYCFSSSEGSASARIK